MKVFWLRLYPKDPVTGNEVEHLFTTWNDKRATTIVPGKIYLPFLENYPRLEVAIFEGAFDGKSAVRCDNLTISQASPNLITWPNLVWDGARVELFKGYDTDTTFATVKQIFTGLVDKSPEFKNNSVNLNFSDLSGNLQKEFLTQTYLGTGGVEGPTGAKGALKPLCLGKPKGVAPLLIDAANVVFQYSAYAETIGVQSLWENGISFGAKKGTVAYAGSIQATYDALKAFALTVGQWADAPSIGMFRLGGEPAQGGVITADVHGIRKGSGGALISTIADCLDYMFGAAGEGARIDAANLAVFQIATGGMTISDYFDDQQVISEIIERYLESVGGYYFYNSTGGVRFNLIRMVASTYLLATDGRTTPVVEEVNVLPVSAPVKELKMGVDKNFRVHNDNEISDALLVKVNEASFLALTAQELAQQAIEDIDNIETQMNTIGADGILSRVEKQMLIGDRADLTRELPDLTARATTYSIVTEKNAYTTALAALDAHLASITPAWNNTTLDSPITRATFTEVWREAYYRRAMLVNEIAEKALYAEQAGGIVNQGPGATAPDLNGFDRGSFHKIMQALNQLDRVAKDGVVTRQEKASTLIPIDAALEARFPIVTALAAEMEIGGPRQNLVAYSSAFDRSQWSKIRASVIANALSGPDGALTMDSIKDATLTAIRYINQNYNGDDGRSVRAIVKQNGRSIVAIGWSDGLNTPSAYNLAEFNIATGVFIALRQTAGQPVGTPTITAKANGCYEIRYTLPTPQLTGKRPSLFMAAASPVTTAAAADNTKGIGVQDFQLLNYNTVPEPYFTTQSLGILDSGDPEYTSYADSRNAYLAARNLLVPAWNNPNVDSLLGTGAQVLASPANLAVAPWTALGGAAMPIAASGYYTLSDGSSSAMGGLKQTYTTTADRVSAIIEVEKDAIPRSARSFLLRLAWTGGNSVGYFLDTNTGELFEENSNPLQIPIPVNKGAGVIDAGTYWLIWISGFSGAGSAVSMELYPSGGIDNLQNNSATGSVRVRNPVMWVGAIDIARESFQDAISLYETAEEELRKVIGRVGYENAFWEKIKDEFGLKPSDNADVTSQQQIVALLDAATGRIVNALILNAAQNFGLRGLSDAPVFTDTAVSASSVTINIPARTLRGDWGGTVNLPTGNLTGKNYNTKYHVWRNMDDPSSNVGSYDCHTNIINALAYNKVYLGAFTTRISQTGGSGTVVNEPYNPGGGYYNGGATP